MKKVKPYIEESLLRLPVPYSASDKDYYEGSQYRCSIDIGHLIAWVKKSINHSKQRECFEAVFSEAMPFREDAGYYNYLMALVGFPYDDWLQKKYFPEDLNRIDELTLRIRELNAKVDYLPTKAEKNKLLIEISNLDTRRELLIIKFGNKLCRSYKDLDTYNNFSEFLKVMFIEMKPNADAEEMIFIQAGGNDLNDAFNRAISKKNLPRDSKPPTAAHWALYFIFRELSGEGPQIDIENSGKKQKILKQLSEGKRHWKVIEGHYNSFDTPIGRAIPANIERLQFVIDMLIDSPKAKKRAADELKLIKSKYPEYVTE